MKKILNLTDKIEANKRKHKKHSHRLRSEVVQRTVQCSSCRLSCAMCGIHLEGPDEGCPGPSPCYTLNLCEHCRAEYLDFIKSSKKGKATDLPWHNEEWFKLWSHWIEYQKAIRAFRNSKEYKQLLEEFES